MGLSAYPQVESIDFVYDCLDYKYFFITIFFYILIFSFVLSIAAFTLLDVSFLFLPLLLPRIYDLSLDLTL